MKSLDPTKAEQVVFRFALVAAGICLILFGLLAERQRRSSELSRQLLNVLYERARYRDSVCPGHPILTGCDVQSVTELRSEIDSANASWGGYYDTRRLFTQLTWIVPATILLAFYLGRWIVVGRMRPLWPLRRP